MRKIISGVISVVLFTLVLPAQGIRFSEGTLQKLKDQARREKKTLFIDCFTDWCGPCKWMTANTFKEEKVGSFFNQHFVCAAFDMEKGEGEAIAEKYEIQSYPTYIFITPEGNLLHRAVGSMEKEDFIKVGMNAIDPAKQFGTLKARYEGGARDTAFLRQYADALAFAGYPSREVADEYLSQVDPKQLISVSGWLFLANHVSELSSPWTAFVDRNRADFIKLRGVEEVESWINYVVQNSQDAYFRQYGSEGLEPFKELLRKYVPGSAEKLEIAADYQFRKDLLPEIAHPYAKAWYDHACESFQELNQIAWYYFQTFDDRDMLQDALWWSKRSVEMYEAGFNTDTEANLLAKLGLWKEAEKMALHSIELSEKAGEDATATQELLKEIQTHL